MSYFIAEHNNGQFLNVNRETMQVAYTTVEQEADWDASERIVQDFIDLLGLSNVVKPKQGTGLNHPPKPPISAM